MLYLTHINSLLDNASKYYLCLQYDLWWSHYWSCDRYDLAILTPSKKQNGHFHHLNFKILVIDGSPINLQH